MDSKLMQWNFIIHNLIHGDTKLQQKFWLEKGKILLKQDGIYLKACVLTENDEHGWSIEEEILPFLKICSLVSNTPRLEGGGGNSLNNKSEFGKKIQILKTEVGEAQYPKEAKKKIKKYIPLFLKQIKDLHKKYYSLDEDNPFLKTSLNYYYQSEINSVYNNDGFVNAMMSLEALFNDGQGDISYKLQKRASFVLGFYRYKATDVFDNLKKFSTLRNAIVHGYYDIPKVENRHKISNYARVCLIIMHVLCNNTKRKQIKKNEKKKMILDEIDKAMLDNSIRKSLEKEIKKGLIDFKLKVPRQFEGKGEWGKYRVHPFG